MAITVFLVKLKSHQDAMIRLRWSQCIYYCIFCRAKYCLNSTYFGAGYQSLLFIYFLFINHYLSKMWNYYLVIQCANYSSWYRNCNSIIYYKVPNLFYKKQTYQADDIAKVLIYSQIFENQFCAQIVIQTAQNWGSLIWSGGLMEPQTPNSRTQTTALTHPQLEAAYRTIPLTPITNIRFYYKPTYDSYGRS